MYLDEYLKGLADSAKLNEVVQLSIHIVDKGYGSVLVIEGKESQSFVWEADNRLVGLYIDKDNYNADGI